MVLTRREQKGMNLFAEKRVQEISQSKFVVRSETDLSVTYHVEWAGKKWACTCPDFFRNHKSCKHIHAVSYYLTIKAFIPALKSSNDEELMCPYCHSTENSPHAQRLNKSGPVKRLRCKNCKKTFTDRHGFEGMKNQAKIIATALDLFYKGLSLRKISEHLEMMYCVKICHTTIYYWLAKFVQFVEKNASTDPITTGERQGADETMVRIRGRHILLWGLLDRETKILVAEHISTRRSTEEAIILLEKGQSRTAPEADQVSELTTDGLGSYPEALRSLKNKRTTPLIHIQGPGLTGSGGASNNETERLMGTIKERIGLAKHLDSEESAKIFSAGFREYYNSCRGHMALGGKTPAQAAGLEKKKLTWIDLISKAHDRHNQSKK
ncbi:MAG: DDE-type integrase/transposase/recombinase [Candidatus Bathyarchaeia archaeon]|jgi:transposase-like protein